MPAIFTRTARIGALACLLPLLVLAGCSKNHGELVVDDTVGVTALRTPCPLIDIPEMTGDVTLLAPGRLDSNAIDAVAVITDLRKTCDNGLHLPKLTARADFEVLARRNDTHGARHIDLPYFTVVERGGSTIVAKSVSTIGIDFADGQARASAHGTATAVIDRDEATLSPAIRAKLIRKRKPGDTDAAIDPLSLPEVKAALAKATFEMLIGFQLTDQQLAYNARR
jgi:hypothetical protein